MTSPAAPRRPHRPWPARVVAWLAAGFAVGSGLLAVGHAGVSVPLISALGPGGDRAVPVAATLFAVGTLLFVSVAAAAAGLRPWAWPLAVLVFCLTLVGAAVPYRGAGSAVGILGALLALGVLGSPPGRDALLRRTTGTGPAPRDPPEREEQAAS